VARGRQATNWSSCTTKDSTTDFTHRTPPQIFALAAPSTAAPLNQQMPMQPRYRPSSDAPPARAWRTHGTLSRARDESGQALAEFAIILPVFLLVLFGVVQFSLAFNAANDQTHVANQVARFAIVDENPGADSL